MFLFRHIIEPFFSLVTFGRTTQTVEAVEPDTPLGKKFAELYHRIGNCNRAEIYHFPPEQEGLFAFDVRPNAHIMQMLGHSELAGTPVWQGDVAKLSSPELVVKSVPASPCTVALMWYDGSLAPAEMQSKPTESDDLVKQIMVVDYLNPDQCRQIIDTLAERTDEHKYAHVLSDPKGNKTTLMLEVRKTETMMTNDSKLVEGMLRDIIIDAIEPFFGTTMELWNTPVLLKYEPGGFFLPHVDGEQFQDGEWFRIYDRDYTMICFLNDDYEGGELSFPDQNFTVQPKTGRVVAFPADHRFRHGAEVTKSGIRYQMVTWITAFGTVRTRTPPNTSVIQRSWE